MAMDGRLTVFYGSTVIISNCDITYMAKYTYKHVRLAIYLTINHLKYLKLFFEQDAATV